MSTHRRLIFSLAGIFLSGGVLAVQPSRPPVAPALPGGQIAAFNGTDGVYALVDGSKDRVTMTDRGEEGEQIRQLRKTVEGPFLWFRNQGKAYFLQEAALLARVNAAWQPMQEVGRQISNLSTQIDTHGNSTDALGKQMPELATRQEQAAQAADQAIRAVIAEALRSGKAKSV